MSWQAWRRGTPPPSLGPGELHVWRAGLEAGGDALRELAGHLSEDERGRAARFVFAEDRARFVVARGLLRELLGAHLGRPPAALTLAYARHGKPFLEEPDLARLRFSVSHSGGLALIALAWGREVGVDVEAVSERRDYALMLDGVLTGRERRELAALPEARRRAAFFRAWVRKEAYLKARGDGLTLSPDSFEVSLREGEEAQLRLPPTEPRWSLHALEPGEGYAAAAVVEGPGAELRLLEIAWGA